MVNWEGDTSPLFHPPPPKVYFPLPFIIQVVSFNVSVKCRLSPIKRVHVRFGFSSYSSIFHYFHISMLGEEDINTLGPSWVFLQTLKGTEGSKAKAVRKTVTE